MDKIIASTFMANFVIGLFLAYCFVTGVIHAFHVSVILGIASILIAPLGTLAGISSLFNYDLMMNLALALHMI